ncbi:protein kinase domain-containing protein [Amycolatopsis dongchuanensis]|uniref:protein kinase domain-containing protein n=1 Tax=Amycolatopsis dongchuanensis TaxID=1070866 RepID=UPI0031F851B0
MTAEGELIAGRYRLVSRIGRGSMGVVWQARDERLDRTVAVKQLVLDETVDAETAEQAVRRAIREGRVAARLRHPHAITVHDVVEHDGKPCLVLEYLPSRSLAALSAERGPLEPAYVASIGRQVASALAAAHVEGIVHRDVTPGNVLITPDGTAKLADFGISRAVGEGTVTGGGVIAGTPAFLAPEVAGGGEAVFASDVFSLGATLYFAVEGAPPFGRDENPYALLQRAARGEVVPPRQAGPLTDVLSRMLRSEPLERPRMEEVEEALNAVAEGRPAPPPRDPTLLLPARRKPSRRLVFAGVGAVALLGIGGVVGSLLRGGDDTTAASGQPVSAVPPPAPASTSPTPDSGCVADYRVTNSWPNGYQVEVTVRADGGRGLTGWAVRWQLPSGESINNLWNGTLVREGGAVTVTNASYNAVVSPNGTTSFGFVAAMSGSAPGRPTVSCDAS